VHESDHGDERIDKHLKVYQFKPVLRKLFGDIHRLLMSKDKKWFVDTPGCRIELGAGVAPMRDSFPDVEATDVVPAAHLDRVIDAQNIRVAPGSVRSLFLQNAFHHLPDPESFFRSAQIALAPGGGIIMVEPYWGLLASVVYPRLFKEEGFDKRQKSWNTLMRGPINGANQALSFIIFERDKKIFESKFPDLKIIDTGIFPNYPRYLASGGLNFPQLLPDRAFEFLERIEGVSSLAARVLGLHHWIVIRKS